MPIYLFEDDRDGLIYEIIQGMNDEHIAFAKDGHKLNRIFQKPNAAIDTQNNPLDHKKNLQKIANTKGTLGDMMDFSKEQSVKREEKLGFDPVKQETYKKYKETRGVEHPEARKEKAKKLTKEVMIKYNSKLK